MGQIPGEGERGRFQGEHLLYLTDERLQQGIELLFFAYRGSTADSDDILRRSGLGRAHHRALHFIGRAALSVSALLGLLEVTRQSLNRVLRDLEQHGLIRRTVGPTDRRQRLLVLTDAGRALERKLSEAQQARMRRAYREAGPEAVVGFRFVLERLIDEHRRGATLDLVYGRGGR